MKKYYRIICIAIIALLCLRVVMLNSGEGLLIGGDTGIRGVFPLQTLKDALYMWSGSESSGRDNTYSTTIMIPMLFLLFLKVIGFSQHVFTNIFFFLFLFIPGISCYFLIRYLLGKENIGFETELCSTIGALFYIFNYFSRMLFGGPWGHIIMVYVFFPLTLLLFIKGINHDVKKENLLYYTILLGIMFLLIFSCNLANTGTAIIILLLYFIFHIITTREFRNSIKFVLWMSVWVIFLSAFIIVPMISSLSLQANLQRNIDLGWFSPGSWLYARSNFLNLFRLDGAPDLCSDFKKFVYMPIAIIFSYFLPIIAYSSVFWLKKNRYILFFVIAGMLGLFLAKGGYRPLGCIFFYIGKLFPPFTVFKFSYDKFGILISISYAVLSAFSIQQYMRILNIRFKLFAVPMVVLPIIPVFLYVSSPFLKDGLGTKNFFLKIPQSYCETVEWINKKRGDFKLLSLPAVNGYWNRYSWGYVGMDPLIYLLNNPIVESFSVPGGVFGTLINDRAYWEMCNILKLFNIKYLLLHKNLIDFPPVLARNVIGNRKGFSIKKSFNELDIFEVKDKFYNPHIYTNNSPTLVISNHTDAIYQISYSKIKNNAAIFFSRDIDKLKYIIKDNPRLETVVYDSEDINDVNIDKWLEEMKLIKEKNASLLNDVKAAYVFRGDGKFDIEKDGWFRVKAVVSAKPYLTKKKTEISRISFDGLNGYDMNTCNVTYNYLIDDSGILILQAYFDGDRYEDEFIQVCPKDIKVNLQEYPYFFLRYKVESAKMQTIEIVVDVDLNGDNIVEDTIRGLYPNPASEEFGSYVINIYDLVKERHPDVGQCNVINVGIYPHKIWWTDCSGERVKGQYKFWLKDAGFYGYPVVKGHNIINKTFDLKNGFNQWQSKYYPPAYEVINGDGKIVLSSKSPSVEMSRNFSNVNIEEYSFLDLKYFLGKSDKIESLKLILNLDNGKKLELVDLPVSEGSNRYNVNIREIIDDRFWKKDKYCLTKLIFKFGLKSEVVNNDNIFLLDKAWLYNKIFDSADGYIFKRPVFRLDKDVYKFAKKFSSKDDSPKAVFKKKIFLKKGEHHIENLIGKDLDFIILETEEAGKISRQPEVLFNRINSTRYEVKLTADKPCWLVFSESFNPKWKAYVYKSQIPNTKYQIMCWSALWQAWKDRGKRVELKEHYKVNGYANAWYIDKVKNEKSKVKNNEVDIIIEYIPQRFFELGCIVTVLSIIFAGMGLLWMRRKRAFD